ncbi:MAG TPA: polysaccharide biosynthesis tyrosine autokinase [Gaiellaceae bacterium]|jgi:succinoglycan biosynthesis transport protein ExoP|nr:polysaccharide biosynthesis tyrosine autokinase [Gaiellaceae bacterium]
MELRQFLRAVRAHWLGILVSVVLLAAAAGLLAWTRTPIYEARMQFFVSTGSVPADLSETYQGGLFSQQRVRSYAQIVDSPAVTSRVIERLDLETTPEELGRNIDAEAPVDTVLINVTVRDPSPQRAKAIADAVSDEFSSLVTTLETREGAPNPPVNVTVTREAELPMSPSSPQHALYVALGLLLGLTFGVGAALLREALDDRIRGEDDAAAIASAPALGTIVEDPKARSRPLVVAHDPVSPRAEAYRRLRTNLRLSVDQGLRSFVVSSPVASEGKTLIVANLGIAFAQAGYRVVVVDADLRRPELAFAFGVSPRAGLTDVLVDGLPVETALETWQDGLALELLGSGTPPPNPGELLGSEQFTTVLSALTSRADLVLLDAPALLPVADAAILARVTSGVILVARVGSTRRDELETATQLLRAADEKVFGVVLNRSRAVGAWPYRRPSSASGRVPVLPRLAPQATTEAVDGSRSRLDDASRSRATSAPDSQ